MMQRRELLAWGGTTLAATSILSNRLSTSRPLQAAESSSALPFGMCFNTSTIRGQKLDIEQQVEVTVKAGYDAIEPWIGDLQRFKESGGKLAALRRRIEDGGLRVASAIGFANWIVEDEAERKKGLEVARHDMELVREIGGTRLAAPPAGGTREKLDLWQVADRYRALLEVGRELGVTPQLELWGHSQTLNRLGELAFVAIESNHPDACVMPDVYHIYKGGSGFAGLKLLEGSAIHCFHMNDYPAEPPRAEIGDADRVYPGDGVAPLTEILRTLRDVGFRGDLSLELFNREYWKQDPQEVANLGLQKMRATVEKAFA